MVLDDPSCSELGGFLTRFKELVSEADAEALENNGVVPTRLDEEVPAVFRDLRHQFNNFMYGLPGLDDLSKPAKGPWPGRASH